MFSEYAINEDLKKLYDAIDSLPNPPACENFPDAFYPDYKMAGGMALEGYARSLCDPCPLKAACGKYGVYNEEYGIWGGLSAKERNKLRKQLGIVLEVREEY